MGRLQSSTGVRLVKGDAHDEAGSIGVGLHCEWCIGSYQRDSLVLWDSSPRSRDRLVRTVLVRDGIYLRHSVLPREAIQGS